MFVRIYTYVYVCMGSYYTYLYTHIEQKTKKILKFKLLVSTENGSKLMAASFIQFISVKVPITILKNLLYIASQYILT